MTSGPGDRSLRAPDLRLGVQKGRTGPLELPTCHAPRAAARPHLTAPAGGREAAPTGPYQPVTKGVGKRHPRPRTIGSHTALFSTPSPRGPSSGHRDPDAVAPTPRPEPHATGPRRASR